MANTYDMRYVLFMQVFRVFFHSIFCLGIVTHRICCIGDIDPHASDGNAVAGQSVEVWGMASKGPGTTPKWL